MRKWILSLLLLLTPMLMAERVPMPYAKIQFFDRNGKPLSAGRLYTYVAGTTTYKATYTSSTGGANTNPVILDSAGRANIWLDCTTSYKFILKDSADVQLWSVDNVTDYGCKTEAEGATAVDLTNPANVTGILTSANGGTGSGFTKFTGPAASEKTFTLPNASDTIATFAQKNIFTKAQLVTPVTLTVAGDGTIDTDASLSNWFRATLTANCPCILQTPTNPTNGQIATWEIIQANAGSKAMDFSSSFGFGTTVTKPTITITSDKRDFITAVYNGTAVKWYVLYVTQAY